MPVTPFFFLRCMFIILYSLSKGIYYLVQMDVWIRQQAQKIIAENRGLHGTLFHDSKRPFGLAPCFAIFSVWLYWVRGE